MEYCVFHPNGNLSRIPDRRGAPVAGWTVSLHCCVALEVSARNWIFIAYLPCNGKASFLDSKLANSAESGVLAAMVGAAPGFMFMFGPGELNCTCSRAAMSKQITQFVFPLLWIYTSTFFAFFDLLQHQNKA